MLTVLLLAEVELCFAQHMQWTQNLVSERSHYHQISQNYSRFKWTFSYFQSLLPVHHCWFHSPCYSWSTETACSPQFFCCFFLFFCLISLDFHCSICSLCFRCISCGQVWLCRPVLASAFLDCSPSPQEHSFVCIG